MEKWKTIPDYPNYEVSDEGHVRNARYGNMLKPQLVKGYTRVVLCKNNQCAPRSVHRLVATAYCEGADDNLQVNHKDGNKTNNSADNLEWVTPGQNQKHAYDTGLKHPPCPNPRKVRIVETDEIFDTITDCAKHVNGSKRHISECLQGRRKTHRGYHYEDIE